MAQKKMNQGEVRAVVSKIIREVNEINKASNEALMLSPKYIADIEAIKSKDPIYELNKEIESLIKIKFGTGERDQVYANVDSIYGSDLKKKSQNIVQKVRDYNKKHKKEIISDSVGSTDFKKIYEEIVIAQIDTSDVNLLINSIKSKLI